MRLISCIRFFIILLPLKPWSLFLFLRFSLSRIAAHRKVWGVVWWTSTARRSATRSATLTFYRMYFTGIWRLSTKLTFAYNFTAHCILVTFIPTWLSFHGDYRLRAFAALAERFKITFTHNIVICYMMSHRIQPRTTLLLNFRSWYLNLERFLRLLFLNYFFYLVSLPVGWTNTNLELIRVIVLLHHSAIFEEILVLKEIWC